MISPHVAIPLKRFLLIEQCPEAWQGLDLYLFRDEAVVFYVGQSHLAFARVWEHLINGFKGRSMMGRFIWCNWPTSMKFTIELWSSQSEPFNRLENNVLAAERLLIEQGAPCFNVSQNRQPTAVPAAYYPSNGKLRCSRSLPKLIREVERVVKAEDNKLWLQALDSL